MAIARVPHAHMLTLAAAVLAKGENSRTDRKQKINRGLVLENQTNLVVARGMTHPIIEQLPSSSLDDQHAHALLGALMSTKSSRRSTEGYTHDSR